MATHEQTQIRIEQDNVDDSVVQQLVSADRGELLNIVDKLRSFGISRELDLPLPQIIVCGDQSSGKSSVLEAISGRPFPKGDSVCTTFATELALRRDTPSGISVHIKPATTRSASESERLANFTSPASENFETTVKEAKKFLRSQRQTGEDSYFEDVLRIEITHPNLPDLTLVDLPGIIHVANRRQVEKDVDVVYDLVMSYMKNENSIILAVISAQNDLENQKILRMVKQVDPKGKRTLGVITKPDTLLPGSKPEGNFVRCAKNEEHRLELGWHVVKNRSQEVQTSNNLSDRKNEEDDFFAHGVWRHSLKPGQLGINALRTRLSTLLEQRTRQVIPSILSSIKTSLSECEGDLAKLGNPRTTPSEKRKYLTEISCAFQTIIQQSVNGSYTDRSFFSHPTSTVDPVYLRAAIINLNDGFASIMRQYGHSKEFIDSISEEDGNEGWTEISDQTSNPKIAHFIINPPKEISIRDYLYEVEELSAKMRGAEQPGLPNQRIIADLFRSQSERWESIAAQHIDKVSQVSQKTLELIASHVASEETASLLRRHLIAHEMEKKYSQAMQTLKMLLAPYKRDIIITLDESFIGSIKNLHIGNPTAQNSYSAGGTNLTGNGTVETENIQCNFHTSRFSLDYMLAYYKVALRNFIDNVANFAIEQCFIDGMAEILTPMRIADMSTVLVDELTAESEGTVNDRRYKLKQRQELRDALDMCRIVSYRVGHDTRTNRPISAHTTASAHGTPKSSSSQSSHDSGIAILASDFQNASDTIHTTNSGAASVGPISIPSETTISTSTPFAKNATHAIRTTRSKAVVRLPPPNSAFMTENTSQPPAAKLDSPPKSIFATLEKPITGTFLFTLPPTTSTPPSTSGTLSSSGGSQSELRPWTSGSIFGGASSTSTSNVSSSGSTQEYQKSNDQRSSSIGLFGQPGPTSGPFTPSKTSTTSSMGSGGFGTESKSTTSSNKSPFESFLNSQTSHNSTTSKPVLFGSGSTGSTRTDLGGQTSTASGSVLDTSNFGGLQGNKSFQAHVDETGNYQSITAMPDFSDVSFEVRRCESL